MHFWNLPLRDPLEEAVSAYQGREWRVRDAKDLSDFACHPCAVLSDGAVAIFAKYSEASDAAAQFENELAGLRYLSELAGVMIPTPIGVLRVANGTLLIMEALDVIERGPRQWQDLGRTLARIHRVTSDRCGFHMDGFIGPLEQDNTPTRDWTTFYGERRLWPRLRVAIDSGNLPLSVASRVERLILRLPELCGPEVTPSLLHGDAQQNNFISTAKGTVVIDPAVYYGHPESDVALIGCWQPAPDEVFDGYREEMVLDPGFWERRSLWRISLYLAAVALEGPMHLGRLTDALQGYV